MFRTSVHRGLLKDWAVGNNTIEGLPTTAVLEFCAVAVRHAFTQRELSNTAFGRAVTANKSFGIKNIAVLNKIERDASLICIVNDDGSVVLRVEDSTTQRISIETVADSTPFNPVDTDITSAPLNVDVNSLPGLTAPCFSLVECRYSLWKVFSFTLALSSLQPILSVWCLTRMLLSLLDYSQHDSFLQAI